MSVTPSIIPVTSFERLRLETYTEVAAAALLVYDVLLNFDREVAFLWPSHWGLVKVLYFVTRYMAFVDIVLVMIYQLTPNITAETCRQFYIPAGYFIVAGIIVAELILMVRTWAIWGRGKRLTCFLAFYFLGIIIPALVIEHIFLNSVQFAPYPGRATPGCLLSSGNPIIAVDFVLVILLETFTLVMTLIKGIQHYRIAGNRNFAKVLYRDGLVFYVYLLCVSVTNLIVIIAAPRDLANILTVLQRVLHSCLSARVLLNLREARRKEANPSANSYPLGSRPLAFRKTGQSTYTDTTITSDRSDDIALQTLTRDPHEEELIDACSAFGRSGGVLL